MHKRAALALALAGLAAGAVFAETLVVGDRIVVRESNTARPSRGMLMADVERRFGAPATRHAAVGEPPITRWDYAQFSVFFERDRVIHAVVTGDTTSAPATSPDSSAAPANSDAPAVQEASKP
jgi:hypothetical protein